MDPNANNQQNPGTVGGFDQQQMYQFQQRQMQNPIFPMKQNNFMPQFYPQQQMVPLEAPQFQGQMGNFNQGGQ